MKAIIDAFLFQVQEKRRAAERRKQNGDMVTWRHFLTQAEAIEDAAVEVFSEQTEIAFDEDEFRADAQRL